MYARSAIPVYWIVNLTEHWIEVYENPIANASDSDYQIHQTYSMDEHIPLTVDGVNVETVFVCDLLPN